MTIEEAKKELLKRKLITSTGYEAFRGAMRERLNLKSNFSFDKVFSLEFDKEDFEKIYNYYIELYSIICSIECDITSNLAITKFHDSYININPNIKKVIEILEEEMGFKNKFIKEKKSKNLPLLLAVGIGIGAGIYFVNKG